MKPALVILAAGVGARYGGLKQLDGFGPNGETIMDYSVYDALRAGFGQVVFVIRPEMEEVFRAGLGARIEPHAPVVYVHQRLDALPPEFTVPPGRSKPWGTGQAVLATAGVVTGPFVVANADDLYGASAFALLAEFLRQEDPAGGPTYALVGYALRDTLSAAGTVSRGVCRCRPDGWLESIVETTGIEKYGREGRFVDEQGGAHFLSGDTLVSMNVWAFRVAFFDQLRRSFEAFLRRRELAANGEFYLPAAVADAICQQRARVKVLPTRAAWIGVTHRQDRPAVTQRIRELVEQGVYPRQLWPERPR